MKRVLVIDDEPDIGSLVSLCLDAIGVEVVTADGLLGAREVVRGEDVGLVLLDLSLGAEDGLEILPQLREEPALDGVPVIAFTAHDSRRTEAYDSGVDSFLSRPFLAADLRAAVELFLVS